MSLDASTFVRGIANWVGAIWPGSNDLGLILKLNHLTETTQDDVHFFKAQNVSGAEVYTVYYTPPNCIHLDLDVLLKQQKHNNSHILYEIPFPKRHHSISVKNPLLQGRTTLKNVLKEFER